MNQTMQDDITRSSDKVGLPFAVWVTWEAHARTRNIAAHIGVELEEIVINKSGLRRYVPAIFRTVTYLISRKPKVLIVQSPSMILTALALVLRSIFRYRLVMDAHNEAVEPYVHTGMVMRWLTNRCIRNADLTIVTNAMLAKVVSAAGGRAFVLPDKIPDYAGDVPDRHSENSNVVMIATYADDEPVEEFLAAVGELGKPLTVYVTGRAEKLPAEVRARTGTNVHFTGYLDEQAYWKLLAGADAIVDLTLKDNCLVCGAYEGIAVGKPLILSDSEATRAHFSKGVLYVDNSVAGIKNALEVLQERRLALNAQAVELRNELRSRWVIDADRLVAAVRAMA